MERLPQYDYLFYLWISIPLSFLLNDSFLYNYNYISKLIIMGEKILTEIFSYFSNPLRLLYSLIVHECGNFLSSLLLFATSFFL